LTLNTSFLERNYRHKIAQNRQREKLIEIMRIYGKHEAILILLKNRIGIASRSSFISIQIASPKPFDWGTLHPFGYNLRNGFICNSTHAVPMTGPKRKRTALLKRVEWGFRMDMVIQMALPRE